MIPALIVPVLNRPDLLDRLLHSIDYPVRDLLIIDNGDVVRRRPYVPQAERLTLIKSPTNLGVPASWNLGIKMLPFATYWMVVNSDAWFPTDALDRLHVEAKYDALVLSAAAPPWACFIVGQHVVSKVGLFDEGIHPAYFEDNDYERRCTFHGFPVVQSGVRVNHDNSSTIGESRYRAANDRTFAANANYYAQKVQRGDFTEGRWDLSTRRALSWD
jgi:GT2 family glycosyltransferase